MIKQIKVFDELIPVKNYLCSSNQRHVKGNYKFNLYIKITDYCNASCKFCSNQNSVPKEENIDLNKLEKF